MFNEHMNSRTDITISATLGIHFPEQEDPIDFDGKITVTVEKPPPQSNPTYVNKWGNQGGIPGSNGTDPNKIYWGNEPGKGYEFINSVTGGAIPKEFIEPVNQGIQGAMQSGVLAGYNVVDVKVTLYDGSYHEVDSSEMAFKIAGSMAFKEAMRKANPVLTEPIMKVVTVVPDDYLGDVIGGFNSRRGQIQSMDPVSGAQQITAMVPLSEMFGYATALRSMTQGRGQYSMEPSHFAEVPKSIQEEIVSARAKN